MNQPQTHYEDEGDRGMAQKLVRSACDRAVCLQDEVARHACGGSGNQASERVAAVDQAEQSIDGDTKEKTHAHAGPGHEAVAVVMRRCGHRGGHRPERGNYGRPDRDAHQAE